MFNLKIMGHENSDNNLESHCAPNININNGVTATLSPKLHDGRVVSTIG
jgi:hypothetical protein